VPVPAIHRHSQFACRSVRGRQRSPRRRLCNHPAPVLCGDRPGFGEYRNPSIKQAPRDRPRLFSTPPMPPLACGIPRGSKTYRASSFPLSGSRSSQARRARVGLARGDDGRSSASRDFSRDMKAASEFQLSRRYRWRLRGAALMLSPLRPAPALET
jgi:hypothetical protein